MTASYVLSITVDDNIKAALKDGGYWLFVGDIGLKDDATKAKEDIEQADIDNFAQFKVEDSRINTSNVIRVHWEFKDKFLISYSLEWIDITTTAAKNDTIPIQAKETVELHKPKDGPITFTKQLNSDNTPKINSWVRDGTIGFVNNIKAQAIIADFNRPLDQKKGTPLWVAGKGRVKLPDVTTQATSWVWFANIAPKKATQPSTGDDDFSEPLKVSFQTNKKTMVSFKDEKPEGWGWSIQDSQDLDEDDKKFIEDDIKAKAART